MPAERFADRRWRLLALLALWPLTTLAYQLAGWLAGLRGAAPAWVLPVDAAMPLLPWTLAIYLSLGLFCLVPAWQDDPARFRRLLRAALGSLAACCLVFVAVPAAIDRGTLPDGWWGQAYAWLRYVDPPHNTCPSLHVAYVVLVLAAAPRRWWTAAWGLAIIVSTLTTRQHILIDVAAGTALALAAWRLAGRWDQGRHTAAADGSASIKAGSRD